jgi:hypothetical protein
VDRIYFNKKKRSEIVKKVNRSVIFEKSNPSKSVKLEGNKL